MSRKRDGKRTKKIHVVREWEKSRGEQRKETGNCVPGGSLINAKGHPWKGRTVGDVPETHRRRRGGERKGGHGSLT